MKNIDNDMDELFNKAGQDYPLNTEKKNWEAVYKALHTGEVATPAAKNKWYRFLLPFVLLISLPVAIYLTGIGTRESKTGNEEPTTGTRKSAVESRVSETGDRKTEVGTGESAVESQISKVADRESEIGSGESPVESQASETGGRETEVGTRQLAVKGPKTEARSKGLATDSPRSGSTRRNLGEVVGRQSDTRSTDVFEKNKEPLKSEQVLLKSFLSLPESFNSYELNGSPSENIHQPFKKTPEQQLTETKITKTNPKKTTGFYYGLVAAVDLSTIKLQAIKRPGSSVGLMAGYQFTPHWSVELSGKWSTKKYYSDGKYFDKTRANIPDYVDVYDLTGGCNMFEIPVNVRYLFSPGKNSFFATAGLSTYFMKKESYEYTANAGGGMYEGYRNYKNSGNHPFSNLQLTGGYQFKLFSKTNLRIEPYVLLPLKKVGVGRMPITSAGVQFGLMRITR